MVFKASDADDGTGVSWATGVPIAEAALGGSGGGVGLTRVRVGLGDFALDEVDGFDLTISVVFCPSASFGISGGDELVTGSFLVELAESDSSDVRELSTALCCDGVFHRR